MVSTYQIFHLVLKAAIKNKSYRKDNVIALKDQDLLVKANKKEGKKERLTKC